MVVAPVKNHHSLPRKLWFWGFIRHHSRAIWSNIPSGDDQQHINQPASGIPTKAYQPTNQRTNEPANDLPNNKQHILTNNTMDSLQSPSQRYSSRCYVAPSAPAEFPRGADDVFGKPRSPGRATGGGRRSRQLHLTDPRGIGGEVPGGGTTAAARGRPQRGGVWNNGLRLWLLHS